MHRYDCYKTAKKVALIFQKISHIYSSDPIPNPTHKEHGISHDLDPLETLIEINVIVLLNDKQLEKRAQLKIKNKKVI